MEETNQNQPKISENNDYSMGIVAYLTFIGLIVAYIINRDKKDDFVSYHIRQALGIMLTYLAFFILFFFIPYTLIWVFYLLNLGLFILWVMGLINAIKKEKNPVPLLGEKFDEWFKNV